MAGGYVKGTFTNADGVRRRFPGIVLDEHGARVDGYLFVSNNLETHWAMLDEFEDGYDRVEVSVTTVEGQQVTAWIYQLQPQAELKQKRLSVTREPFSRSAAITRFLLRRF
jgi:gamma-glutamylcyclotransferase (GGCT)/AIG2-like uncharacterized protein YtfP